jgi:type III pantothenate kinase
MILVLDIGNSHTHLGLANERAVFRRKDIPTAAWRQGAAVRQVRAFVGGACPQAVALCSVVPRTTLAVRRALQSLWKARWFELTAATARPCLGIRYPKPGTIGPDRLADAIAARHHCGAPCLVIDFGTAVTFNVVDAGGSFIGGVIAPGLPLMTRYLHEKTALLPEVRVRPVRRAIGRSTGEAIRIAAVLGFQGMARELILRVKEELASPNLPVVATGSYASLIARGLPEITALEHNLTLEGVRLAAYRALPSAKAGTPGGRRTKREF